MLHNHQAHEHATSTLLSELDAQHHAPAAHLSNDAGELSSNLLQTCLEVRTSLRTTTLNILFLNCFDGCNTCGTGQLIATKGRGMQKGRFNKTLPSPLRANNGANGHNTTA